MRYSDLPPKLRAQADEKLGRTATARAKRSSVAAVPGLPLTCTTCSEVFHGDSDPSGRIAAHQAETGHARYEWRPS